VFFHEINPFHVLGTPMTLGNPTEKIIPARPGAGSPVDSPGSVRQTRWHWGLGLPPPGRWMDPGDSERTAGIKRTGGFSIYKTLYIYKYILAHNIYIYVYIYNIICKYTH